MASSKGNPGVQKLLAAMRKLIREVNDKEICNKLEVFISSEKEDIPTAVLKNLLDNPLNFDVSKVPKTYTQYVQHYIYMVKREEKEKQREKEKKSPKTQKRKND